MKKIFHDSFFKYDDDGVLQYYPIDEKNAIETYRNLIKEKDDLRTKINQGLINEEITICSITFCWVSKMAIY